MHGRIRAGTYYLYPIYKYNSSDNSFTDIYAYTRTSQTQASSGADLFEYTFYCNDGKTYYADNTNTREADVWSLDDVTNVTISGTTYPILEKQFSGTSGLSPTLMYKNGNSYLIVTSNGNVYSKTTSGFSRIGSCQSYNTDYSTAIRRNSSADKFLLIEEKLLSEYSGTNRHRWMYCHTTTDTSHGDARIILYDQVNDLYSFGTQDDWDWYISSSGLECIDTSYTVRNGISFQIDFMPLGIIPTTINSPYFVCAGGIDDTSDDRFVISADQYSSLSPDGLFQIGSQRLCPNLSSGTRTQISMSHSIDHYTITIGATSQTVSESSFVANTSLTIFGAENNGSYVQKSNMKLYRMSVSSTGGNIYDLFLVPDKNSTGEPCLYDSVNDEYLFNVGGGTLGYGW